MRAMLGTLNKVILFFLSLTFMPGNLQSQIFSDFHDFISTSQLPGSTAGIEPSGGLVFNNGLLYGTTLQEGLQGYGSVLFYQHRWHGF
jgi:hypothetical protein